MPLDFDDDLTGFLGLRPPVFDGRGVAWPTAPPGVLAPPSRFVTLPDRLDEEPSELEELWGPIGALPTFDPADLVDARIDGFYDVRNVPAWKRPGFTVEQALEDALADSFMDQRVARIRREVAPAWLDDYLLYCLEVLSGERSFLYRGTLYKIPDRYTDEGRARTRAFLLSELRDMGLNATRQVWPRNLEAAELITLQDYYIVPQPGYSANNGSWVYSRSISVDQSIVNILAPAKVRSPIIVGAHYDVGDGEGGANDNGSGVAIALAVARLSTSATLSDRLTIAFYDREEWGALGSAIHNYYLVTSRSLHALQEISFHGVDTVGHQQDRFVKLESVQNVTHLGRLSATYAQSNIDIGLPVRIEEHVRPRQEAVTDAINFGPAMGFLNTVTLTGSDPSFDSNDDFGSASVDIVHCREVTALLARAIQLESMP